jgi:hypothetical protein
VVSWSKKGFLGGRIELEGSLKMSGNNPFSKLHDAMSSERQAANAEATEKAGADSPVTRLTGPEAGAFGSWLVANEGALPEDLELDV